MEQGDVDCVNRCVGSHSGYSKPGQMFSHACLDTCYPDGDLDLTAWTYALLSSFLSP